MNSTKKQSLQIHTSMIQNLHSQGKSLTTFLALPLILWPRYKTNVCFSAKIWLITKKNLWKFSWIMHFWSLKYVSMHWYFQMSSALWPFLQTLFTAKWFESQWHFMKHNLLAQVLWIAFITISYFHLTRTISPRLNLKPFIKATSLCCFLHKQQRQIKISPMHTCQISVFHKNQT